MHCIGSYLLAWRMSVVRWAERGLACHDLTQVDNAAVAGLRTT